MLRLSTLDTLGDGTPPLPVSQALITRALVDLASERFPGGTGGYAIEQFCASLIDDSPRAAQLCVDRLIDCGISVESLYDAYIPRTAARLGELWVDDQIGFSAVTLGMARLTDVFRRLRPTFLRLAHRDSARVTSPRSALLALVPGEVHALGVVMAADYFQRQGWSVRVELRADAGQLDAIVRAEPFDLIGLSAGSRRMIPELSRVTERLRKVAMPGARFLVGGPIVRLDADIAQTVGADASVEAAPDAAREMELVR